MPQVGELYFSVNADITDLKKQMAAVNQTLNGVANQAKETTSKIGGFFSQVASTAAGFLGANAIMAFGQKALASTADLEKATIALNRMIGNTAEAKQLLTDIKKFGAETPFELPGLIQTSKIMIGFGYNTKEVVGLMENLGNAAQGNQEKLQSLALAFGKVKAKGKVELEQLNIVIEAGVPILDELAKKYKTNTAGILDMVSKGKISYKDLEDSMKSLTTGSGQFAGILKEQSQSLSGLASTAMDSLMELARSILELVTPALKAMLKYATSVVDFFMNLSDAQKGAIKETVSFAAVFMSSVGVMKLSISVFNNIKSAINSMKAAFLANPLLLIIAGLVALFYKLGTAITAASTAAGLNAEQNERMRKSMVQLQQIYTATAKDGGDYKDVLDRTVKSYSENIQKIKELSTTSEEYSALLSEINAQQKFLEEMHRSDLTTKQQKEVKELTVQFRGLQRAKESNIEADKKMDQQKQAAAQASADWLAKQKQYYEAAMVLANTYGKSEVQLVYDKYQKMMDEDDKYRVRSRMTAEEQANYLLQRHKLMTEELQKAQEQSTVIAGITLGQWRTIGQGIQDTVAGTFATISDQLAAGQTTFKEAMKQMLISLVNMVEKQILLNMLQNWGYAFANAIPTFGLSIAAGTGNNAALLGFLATAEGLKVAIRKMATGGIVNKPTFAQIGEGKDSEAVLPLNTKTFAGLAQGITDQLSKLSGATSGQSVSDSRVIQLLLDGKVVSEVVDDHRNTRARRMGATNYAMSGAY
jgi:tape measure domain-containing protein